MDTQTNTEPQTTLRVSWRWIGLLLLLIVGAGFAGGLVAGEWNNPPLQPLANPNEQFVATVQEVTISPSTATVDLVQRVSSSIVALAVENGGQLRPLGSGLVMTNDGLIMTTAVISGQVGSGRLLVFSEDGTGMPVSFVGRDEVFGLSFLRLTEGVITPLEMADKDPAIGEHLLHLTRSSASLNPVAQLAAVSGFQLPPESAPAGWQRVFMPDWSDRDQNVLEEGGVFLTEEGVVAGIWVGDNTVLPVTAIQTSLERIIAGQRERDPFEEWGFGVDYRFDYVPDRRTVEFQAVVNRVTPGSAAAQAGLRTGDVVTSINDQEVLWEIPLVRLLAESNQLTLSAQRDGESVSAVLVPG